MNSKSKVIAYIYRNNKSELLVFKHQSFPEAGVQVVGGTVEEGEKKEEALAREIKEESGLVFNVLELRKLGETKYLRRDKPEINYRCYFAIDSSGLPEKWSHVVASDGLDDGLVFDFFWLSISDAHDCLVGNFGELLT